MAASPSGEQFELTRDDQTAVVTEVGAGLRAYSLGDRELLDGYPADELASSGRGQQLLPWPNRIRDGVYRLDGREHRLPLNEAERGNAIHGLVRWSTWTVADRTTERIVLEHVLHPQPGYPFTLELRVEYSLAPDGLSVRTTAQERGRRVVPVRRGLPSVPRGDRRRRGGASASRSDRPRERRARHPGELVAGRRRARLPAPRPVGSVQLDHCFTDLERDADGLARVELDGTTLWVDESYPYLMVFTGDALPDAERRRSIAVEPMSCAPNAFASGDGLVVLDPGETHAAAWGITPRTAA